MSYFDKDLLLYDEQETMDIAYAREYEHEHLKLTYTTPEMIAADERLLRLAKLILSEGIYNEATDIQIKKNSDTEAIVRLRVGSTMRPHRLIHGIAADGLAIVFKRLVSVDIKERQIPQDGRMQHEFEGETYDLRLSFLPTLQGENISIRILYSSRLMNDITALGFDPYVQERVRRVLELPEGLILLTGGTGSGKTTTMYTSINHIMEKNEGTKNVMTIENPIEYTIEGAVQSSVEETFGYTFARALRAILRQNPDVILIGEINDAETASTAVRAASSGHLVFSTLHTNDVLTVAQAMEHYGVPPFKLALALQLVLHQSLPNRLCEHCKKPDMVSTDELKWVKQLRPDEELLRVWRAVGCEKCGHYGYTGRVLVVEMLDANHAYTRLATQGLSQDELEARLMEDTEVSYYPKRYDVHRHLKLGNIDLETARKLLR